MATVKPPNTKSSASKPAAQTTAAPRKPARRKSTATASRRVQSGDVVLGHTAPANVPKVAARTTVAKALTRCEVAISSILENTEDKLQAMQHLLSRSSKDEIAALKRMLAQSEAANTPEKISADDELAPNWRKGGYPYKNLMNRRNSSACSRAAASI